MANFVGVAFDIQTPDELQQRFYEHVQTYFPDWQPREPSLEVAQAEILSQNMFELMTMAADVPPAHMQEYGRLIQIPPTAAVPASTTVTFTAIDTVGHTIPANTTIAWDIGEDTGIGFYTPAEYIIPPGSSSLVVPVVCEQEGIIGNGFSGSSDDVDGPQLVTLLDFIDGIAAVSETTGGEDQEPISNYLNRLSTRLKLLRDGVVRADDTVIYVTTVIDGIGRAICFDNYNSDTDTIASRHVTIVSHDLDGANLSTDKKTEMLAALARTREINFNFHARDPDRHNIGVVASVSPEPDQDPGALALNVRSSLVSALDPTQWGQPTSAQGPIWLNTQQLRIGWVYSKIDRVEGVRQVEGPITITVDGVPSSVDVTLSGMAPLTQVDPADIIITVI
jgi:hypothetical protein